MLSVGRLSKGNNPGTVPSVVIGETEVRSSIILILLPLILQYGVGTKVYKTLQFVALTAKYFTFQNFPLFKFRISPTFCLCHNDFIGVNALMLTKHVLAILFTFFLDYVYNTNHERHCDWLGATIMWIHLFTHLFIWLMSIVLLCFSLWWVQIEIEVLKLLLANLAYLSAQLNL